MTYQTPEWHKKIEPYFAEGWPAYVSCGDGWRELVLDAVNKINKLGVKWEIAQIKEKFGTLRFYANISGISDDWLAKIADPNYRLTEDDQKLIRYALNVDNPTEAKQINDQFAQIIAEAEELSCSTCEGCGKPGERRGGNWIQTLCTSCHNKTKKGNK